MSGFRKATKSTSKARVAIYGPSGAGKTMSALRIATGLGGKIALIDTERGSASKYADRFDFDVVDMESFDIDSYVRWISDAGKAGYQILVIDSLSHGWSELLDEINRIAKAKYGGNTWSAWSDGTPKQRRLVDAILSFPGHVIATMRSKTEWIVEDDGRKKRPRRVGLAPEQGKGIEYEFDILIGVTHDHVASIDKDRSGRFQDRTIEKPGEDFGRELAAWLSDGDEPTPPGGDGGGTEAAGGTDAAPSPEELYADDDYFKQSVAGLVAAVALPDGYMARVCENENVGKLLELSPAKRAELIKELEGMK